MPTHGTRLIWQCGHDPMISPCRLVRRKAFWFLGDLGLRFLVGLRHLDGRAWERLAIWPGLITPAFTRRFAIPDVAAQKAALTGQRAQPLRHHVVIGRTRLWSGGRFRHRDRDIAMLPFIGALGSTDCRQIARSTWVSPGMWSIAHPRVIREAEKGRCPADGATVNAFARSLRLGISDLISHGDLSPSLDEYPSRMRPAPIFTGWHFRAYNRSSTTPGEGTRWPAK